MSEGRFAGRVALVAGTGDPVGAATAAGLRAEGAEVLALDLADDAGRAVDGAVAALDGLDVLVVCAGDGDPRAALDACAMALRAALPAVLARRGAIVVVAPRNVAQSAASRAALLALTRSVAIDAGPQGVRINAVCPGGGDDAPLRRPADPEEVAAVCLFLACEDSAFLTGSWIPVDGGASALAYA